MSFTATTPTGNPAQPRRGGVLLPTIIVLAAIAVAFVIFTGFYTDWLWFESVAKSQVFTIALVTRGIMFGIFASAMALVVAISLTVAYRTRPAYVGMTPEQASLERYREAITPYRTRLALGITILAGLLAGLSGSGEWGGFLLWRNSTPFGITDPQFGLDIGFYTFTYPFLRFILGFAFRMLALRFSWRLPTFSYQQRWD